MKSNNLKKLLSLLTLSIIMISCGGDDELTFSSKYVYSNPIH